MDTTIVIVEHAHSGTTMVAGICQILGVPMVGEVYDEMKWEDLEIKEALEKGKEAFMALVEDRNEQHSIWGFKQPGVWQHSAMLTTCLRNPKYLAIFKDPVSVTSRRYKKAKELDGLINTLDQMRWAARGIRDSGLEVRPMSYHLAVIDPEQFVAKLVKYLGLDVDQENVSRAVRYIQPNAGSPRKPYPKVSSWI